MNIDVTSALQLALLLLVLIVVLAVLRMALSRLLAPVPGERAATFKFRTLVLIALAVVLPLWPVTMPWLLLLAHRSYREGDPAGAIAMA